MEKGHTSREFERELRSLRDKLLTMGGRAEQQIERAAQALIQSDAGLAAQVIAEDAAKLTPPAPEAHAAIATAIRRDAHDHLQHPLEGVSAARA